MEWRGILLRNLSSCSPRVKLPLLVFLPTVNVGGRDVVGIEFFVFSEIYEVRVFPLKSWRLVTYKGFPSVFV